MCVRALVCNYAMDKIALKFPAMSVANEVVAHSLVQRPNSECAAVARHPMPQSTSPVRLGHTFEPTHMYSIGIPTDTAEKMDVWSGVQRWEMIWVSVEMRTARLSYWEMYKLIMNAESSWKEFFLIIKEHKIEQLFANWKPDNSARLLQTSQLHSHPTPTTEPPCTIHI